MKKWILLFSVALLAACGTRVEAGTIVGKEYVPAKDWTSQEPTYAWIPHTHTSTTCSGKPLVCRTSTYTTSDYTWIGMHTEYHHDDQKWVLHLKDKDGNPGDVTVPQTVYSEQQIGNWYGAKS